MTETDKHIETIETILFTAATNGASLVQEIHVPALRAAIDALHRTAEDDKAREEFHTLPGKSICVPTCNGKRLTIVIDVEAALSERGGEE